VPVMADHSCSDWLQSGLTEILIYGCIVVLSCDLDKLHCDPVDFLFAATCWLSICPR